MSVTGGRWTGRLPQVAQRVRRAPQRAWWRVRDYAYVLRRQAVGVLVAPGRHGPLAHAVPEHAADVVGPREGSGTGTTASGAVTVVLVPGVYEDRHFLRPLARELHAAGHPVHVVPALGRNRLTVREGAVRLLARLAELGADDVVVVAHSKGGLIGKLAMLQPQGSGIRHMVAVATPFGGSTLARFVPLGAVRAFVPTDATLLALAAEHEVNTRITSVYSRWDPHIPSGSVLTAAAANVELATPGHFRVLADPDLVPVVLQVLRATPSSSASSGR